MPRFTKKKWEKKYIKNSHNCYSYMLDKINKRYVKICKNKLKKTKKKKCGWLKPQPGMYAGIPDIEYYKEYNCGMLNNKVLKDNKYIYMTKNNKCSKDYYKGMLFIQPKRAYHFYREDNDGNWSHKNGLSSASRRDAKGKIIKNPIKSSRDYRKKNGFYLSRHCGTYCIPRSKKKKFFSSYTRKINNRKSKRKNNRKSKRKNNRKRR